MDSSPVFMHTIWRSRGTYFWSLFRRNENFRAYYEPLNESLGSKTATQLEIQFRAGQTAQVLRHNEVMRPYFEEYPFDAKGGVTGFDPTLSFSNFFLKADDEDARLEAYFRWLIQFAELQGQRAFFKTTRCGMRSGFLRRKFGGQHYYVNRPPAEVSASFASYGAGSYFTAAAAYILLRYRARPFCGAAIEELRTLGPLDCAALPHELGDDLAAVHPLSRAMNRQQISLMAACLWLAYLADSAAVADLLIDTERLGTDEAYRCELGGRMAHHLGADPFASFHAKPCVNDLTALAPQLRAVLAADDELRAAAADMPGVRLAELGAASRRLLDAIL